MRRLAALLPRRCKRCTGPLPSRNPRAVYCSDACKQRAYRIRRDAAQLAQLVAGTGRPHTFTGARRQLRDLNVV